MLSLFCESYETASGGVIGFWMMPKLKLQTYHLRYYSDSPPPVLSYFCRRSYYDLRHLNRRMLKASSNLNASDNTDLYDVNINASVALWSIYMYIMYISWGCGSPRSVFLFSPHVLCAPSIFASRPLIIDTASETCEVITLPTALTCADMIIRTAWPPYFATARKDDDIKLTTLAHLSSLIIHLSIHHNALWRDFRSA